MFNLLKYIILYRRFVEAKLVNLKKKNMKYEK